MMQKSNFVVANTTYVSKTQRAASRLSFRKQASSPTLRFKVRAEDATGWMPIVPFLKSCKIGTTEAVRLKQKAQLKVKPKIHA